MDSIDKLDYLAIEVAKAISDAASEGVPYVLQQEAHDFMNAFGELVRNLAEHQRGGVQ